jgi:signal transduction histidine kinase
LWFVAAEALTNVAKHADASAASVVLTGVDGWAAMTCRDDGRGGADPSGGGLRGLADRVAAIGGRLDLDSEQGAGTTIEVVVPCGS